MSGGCLFILPRPAIKSLPMTISRGGRVSAELTPNGAFVLSRALAPSRPDFWDPAGPPGTFDLI